MYLFQEVGKTELGFPNHECMNEWLGEPVLVSQLPGRGILRIYINNLVVKRVFVSKIEHFMGKQKSPHCISPGFFLFSHGKTK